MSPISRSLYYVSLFCTFLSLIVHGASFAGRDFPQALFLVPLLFIIWPMTVWQWRRIPHRNLVSEVFVTIPLWMKLAAGFCLLYPFINYFVCVSVNDGGLPVQLADGRLVLQRGQQIIRELDAAGFSRARAVETRMLSGHLLAFYGVAVITLRALWLKSSTAAADIYR